MLQRQYWWAGLNRTQMESIEGSFLWSPFRNKDGRNNHFYDNMEKANIGDFVFSFADKKISYVGSVLAKSIKAPQPNTFGQKAKDWAGTGWLLRVEWEELKFSFSPEKNINHIRDLLPKKYSPYNVKLNKGQQGAYLAQINEKLAKFIILESKQQIDDLFKPSLGEKLDESDRSLLQSMIADKNLSDTEKRQVANARIGQGEFRQNVFKFISNCPVTGICDENLLIASHIKAWRDCDTYQERLDGENGLPLAPHIDKLFDKGLITFDDDGILIASKHLSHDVQIAWGLIEKIGKKVMDVTFKRSQFLTYHRRKYFIK